MEIRVSIFEDNKLVRDALQTILNGTPGYTCSGAFADGNRWEFDIKRSNPDVVLMDIEMPGLNGIELQAALNEQDARKPPMIFMTSYSDNKTRAAAMSGGAFAFLGKPVNFSQLVQCLEQALKH